MKGQRSNWDSKQELTRIDRITLHLRCLVRDHKYRWHMAGIWREVVLH
jgi:hypothetical protein